VSTTDCLVLGATGYVGGECLRLVASHPHLRARAALARSATGTRLAELYGHFRGSAAGELAIEGLDQLERHVEGDGRLAVLVALPHGVAAAEIERLLSVAGRAGRELAIVDISADFRLDDRALWESVYGRAHGAPELLASGLFTCALPELTPGIPSPHVAHPGCFTTATTLACAPLAALGLTEPRAFVSAVTGSTGSGREPSATTHHPERHGGLRAYGALAHRHQPEMEMLVGRAGGADFHVGFVPHSGPFARGIHATVHTTLREPAAADELRERIASFYADAPMVCVVERPPTLKDVVGSNRCHLALATRGRDLVVFSVIDNLIKGAAGGAVQWLNRLLGLREDAGLDAPALGWA
jgi:N-acetyl-gamma-glutamyl-phosphate reductase